MSKYWLGHSLHKHFISNHTKYKVTLINDLLVTSPGLAWWDLDQPCHKHEEFYLSAPSFKTMDEKKN